MISVKNRVQVRIAVANINLISGRLLCKTPTTKNIDGTWSPVFRKGTLSLNVTTATNIVDQKYMKDLALNGNVNSAFRKYPGPGIYFKPAPKTARRLIDDQNMYNYLSHTLAA